MRYLNIYAVTLLLSVSCLFGQESTVRSVINALDEYAANHPVEKIYLHLDKPYYAAGEYMYFRAYLTDIHLSVENAESQIIYVELSDGQKKLVKRVILYSEKKEYIGQILLPDTLPPAEYHLRAYTNWMRNAGEDYFYHRDVYIGNKNMQQQSAALQPFDYQVSFFPEGGQLLSGCPNRVAFKALGNDGFGADITGILSDSEDHELLRFNSLHAGMGMFSFTPEAGKTYQAVIESGGIRKTYPLPAATEGMALSAEQDGKAVYLTLRSTEKHPKSIYIIGQSRHTVCFAVEGMMEDGEELIVVDKDKFPTDITQFTLFQAGHPVSERLVFIDHKDDLQVKVMPDREKYGAREKATLQILVTDSSGNPVSGSFSLSVTDDRTVIPSIRQQNIKGSLLLGSDLKGYIESPGWYFAGDEPERAEALDILMCTQGWSRFTWEKITDNPATNSYPAEKEFYLTGKVTNLLGLPVNNATVSFFSKENLPDKAITDKNGFFGFYGFNCPDTAEFLLQARSKHNGKIFIWITLDKPDNRHDATNFLPLTRMVKSSSDSMMTSYTEQVTNQMKIQEGLWTIELPEIAVAAKKKIDSESFGIGSFRFSGKRLDKPQPIKNILQGLPSPIRGGVVSIFALPHVLYVVDGMLMLADAFDEIFSSYRADMFESVEVLRPEDSFAVYGFEGTGGAYVFTTKKFTGNAEVPDASIQIYHPEGYCVSKEFYMPAYGKPEIRQSTLPDLRTTVYWNPVINTDENGKAEVSFYTADDPASYSYILEGIGDHKVGFTK